MRHRLALLGATAMTLAASFAASAEADFHLMKIREITGESGASNQSYIELQMYAAGQNNVSGHSITFWDADGLVLGMPQPVQTLPLTGTNPPNAQNQRTILIGDVGVVGRDFTLDLTPYLDATTGGNLIAAGAACFEAIPVDCISWGSFTGAANLPDKTLPFGSAMSVGATAVRRKITAGCSTLLEPTDDTDNAAIDWVNVIPGPTPNSAAPVEVPCAAPTPVQETRPQTTPKKCKKRKKKKGRKSASAAAGCKKKKKKR